LRWFLPPLTAPRAYRQQKDRNLLPQVYPRRELSVVKAFDMFRKFGHRVILNGVPVADDYYTAYPSPTIVENLVDMDQNLFSSSSVSENASSPSTEEAAPLNTSGGKTKPLKLSPREEMENRNRVVRLHTGCVKDNKVVIIID
ncbi:MAG: hypothetical protein M1839_005896, partial [Geoglossum umbratile]